MPCFDCVIQIFDMKRSILKPGLKFPSVIMGTLAFMTVEPANPPFIALKTFSGFTPAFVLSINASETAAIF